MHTYRRKHEWNNLENGGGTMNANNCFACFLHSYTSRLATILLVALVWNIPAFSGETSEDAGAGDVDRQEASSSKIAVYLTDGSCLLGIPTSDTIAIKTSFSQMDIPLNQIRRIRFEKDSNKIVIEMRNSDRISGVSSLKSFELSGVIGKIGIKRQYLTELLFDEVMPAGTVSMVGGTYTRYEAENAALSGGAAVHAAHPNYSGTGFVAGYFGTAAAATTFTVHVPSAGEYKVTLRYSSGYGDSTNTGLYINGTKIKNITCNSTGNWDTWGNEMETVILKAGSNTISYKADISSGTCINLDYIDVSRGGKN